MAERERLEELARQELALRTTDALSVALSPLLERLDAAEQRAIDAQERFERFETKSAERDAYAKEERGRQVDEARRRFRASLVMEHLQGRPHDELGEYHAAHQRPLTRLEEAVESADAVLERCGLSGGATRG